ncbi:hypothetical protein DYB36_005538 [Aphanomyces astaci]|uniref:Mur ligase central domain-containing protein n=1 Tax=Aphanomyces astaci TaxID=112090 RepID=A0A397B8D5_APHAT|nr:hypothetical protein DYB36_005538 [Aphanomyces astaci]
MTMYDRLIQRLLRVNQFPHTVKMGLRNSIALHEALGSPAKRFDTIHVAGTNGKGSVSWKLAKALESSGFKTGLFVSPHVSCFRERIQVNSALISEDQVEALLPHIFDKTSQLAIPATFFELTTALALQHFAHEEVDCVVLETGLGGRLDATNIVEPVVSVHIQLGNPLVRHAIASRPPCRFEQLTVATNDSDVTVVLDVAHNLPAFDRLLKLLQVGDTYRDKDIAHVIDSIVATRASHVHFVQGYHPRCASVVEIQHALGEVGASLNSASSSDEVVVVCGSVFIMSEARQALGIDEPVDSHDVKQISGVGLKTAHEREQALPRT